MAEAVFAVGEHGRFVFANLRAEELTGFPIDRLLEKSCADLLTAESASVVEWLPEASRLDRDRCCEVTFLHADGRRIPVELTVSPLRGRSMAFESLHPTRPSDTCQ